MKHALTYKTSGVDIGRMESFKGKLTSLVRRSFRTEVLRDIGGFGSFFGFPKDKFRDPVLVSSADGVGTKLKIATLARRHDTVGIDAVAMNVNDILCTGAEPLFFLDYIAFSRVTQEVLCSIVKGLNDGCRQAGCSLIGGETAQMPGMYAKGEYDLAGFCVGVVERKRIIDGSRITAGDILIGLESSGLHSNGFSLVRKVFSGKELKRLSGKLLKPTRIYVKPVLSLLHITHNTLHQAIHGIAHITGGAFYDKIARILPDNVNAVIRKVSWRPPEIFRLIGKKGAMKDEELYHTLNMGIGMVLAVEANRARETIRALGKFRVRSHVIGEIVKGKKKVELR